MQKKITVKITRIDRGFYLINFLLENVEMPEELVELEGKIVDSGDMVGVAARAECACRDRGYDFATDIRK